MKVVVLCRKIDGMPLNGFDRYSNDITKSLSEFKDLEIILPNQTGPFDIPPSGSVMSPPYYDVFMPVVNILRGKMKGDVFHAVTDGQAVIFPWIKGKKVVTMHHVDKTPPIGIKEKIFRIFYSFGTKMSLKYADLIICVSEQTRREVKEAYDVEDSRLCVVNHAVSDRFTVMPEVQKRKVVGYLGALKNRKNLEFMIRAAAAYKKKYGEDGVVFSICGEGPENERLRSLASQLDVNDIVEFKGRVNDADLVSTYNSFTLFCLPSLQEGFSLPVIEAERCGVPVLTLENAMMPEEVVSVSTKCRDEEDMASKIHFLFENKEAYDEAVKAGLEHSLQFSTENTAKMTAEAYKKALGRAN